MSSPRDFSLAGTDAAAPEVDNQETASLSVHLPVDARGVALASLTTIAVIFALDWAQSFLITLLLGILFAYTLNPLVAGLERMRIPRLVGTLLVMLSVIGALILGAYGLRGQAQHILDQLPDAASKVSAGLNRLRSGPLNNIKSVQDAASTLQKAASQADLLPTQKQRMPRVTIEEPTFKVSNFILLGSRGALAFLGQAIMVMFLVFFFLLGGDMFKRKLVRLAGPTLSRKKITVHILDDINSSIQKYMFMLLVTNLLLGLLTWLALTWIGLQNAGAWAVAAGFLHVIPYAGSLVTAAVLGMAAFMQFETFSATIATVSASLVIAAFVGTFVATWMTGKFAKMNTAAVFVALLFWAWLWGVWGMLLGIPIIVILKVVAQHVEQLHPLAELLSK